MGTIDSKKLNQAISKAKNVGVVELPCTICGCDLVLRSLRSEDYTAALQDCDGLPEEAYIPRYQKGHVARAIVEVNGVDLRSTPFVTVDEVDKSGATKRVKHELHRYLTDHMLNSWGKEAVDVAFKKLGEVLDLAERRAKEGVTFITPDETTEEKFRRLLLETRAAEKDLPSTLIDKILEDQGLMRVSTAEELKRAANRVDQLANEQEATKSVASPPVPVEPAVEPASRNVFEAVVEPVAADEQQPRAAQSRLPVDPHVTLQQAIAARRPPEVKSEQSSVPKPSATRAAQIAALEGSSAAASDLASAISLQPGADDVVEIIQAPIDALAASMIVDTPPAAGINPRFRPPQRA